MPSRFRLAIMICLGCLASAVVVAALCWLYGAPVFGFVVGLLLGIVYMSFGYWASDRFALDLYEAELLDPGLAPRLYEMVQELSAQAGLAEIPLLYAVPLKAPNAFALVRRDQVPIIAVTHGLTESLGREEVRAIVALMVARVAGRQAEVWTVAATLAGAPLHAARSAGVNDTLYDRLEIDPSAGLTVIGKLLLSACLPPCAFGLRLVFDPRAVTDADSLAARLTGDTASLATALTRIQGGLPMAGWGASGYNPASALLFAVPPLPPPSATTTEAPFWIQAQRGFPYQHPDVSERCALLKSAASSVGAARESRGAA